MRKPEAPGGEMEVTSEVGEQTKRVYKGEQCEWGGQHWIVCKEGVSEEGNLNCSAVATPCGKFLEGMTYHR